MKIEFYMYNWKNIVDDPEEAKECFRWRLRFYKDTEEGNWGWAIHWLCWCACIRHLAHI